MKWEELERNLILRGSDFYISYNPQTGLGHGKGLSDIGNIFLALTGSPERLKDGQETALYKKDGDWFILEGDWRKEYEDVFDQGFEACKKVYEKHKADYRSAWSTDKL